MFHNRRLHTANLLRSIVVADGRGLVQLIQLASELRPLVKSFHGDFGIFHHHAVFIAVTKVAIG